MIDEITVIGAGTSGIQFVRRLREKSSSIRITLIDKNTTYYDRAAFFTSLQIRDRIDLETWCAQNDVTFINAVVDRISARKSKIYFKKRELIGFKKLVVACGLSSKKMDLKGETKEGTFYCDRIDPFLVLKLLKVSDEISVYLRTILGCRLALALRAVGKEVRVICDREDIFREYEPDIARLFDERGIVFHKNTFISEIIGETMVKALKINPLKVFPAQLVFLDSGFTVDESLFEEEIFRGSGFSSESDSVFMLGGLSGDILAMTDESVGFNDYQESRRGALWLADALLDEKGFDFSRILLNSEQKRDIIREIFQKCPVTKPASADPADKVLPAPPEPVDKVSPAPTEPADKASPAPTELEDKESFDREVISSDFPREMTGDGFSPPGERTE